MDVKLISKDRYYYRITLEESDFRTLHEQNKLESTISIDDIKFDKPFKLFYDPSAIMSLGGILDGSPVLKIGKSDYDNLNYTGLTKIVCADSVYQIHRKGKTSKKRS
jgi:hypothetical protein